MLIELNDDTMETIVSGLIHDAKQFTELNDDTMETIVSGLIHAEVYHEQDAKRFTELAASQDSLVRRNELEGIVAYHKIQVERFQRARAALLEAKKEVSAV